MARGQRGIVFDSDGSKLLGVIFTASSEPGPTAILLHGIPGIEKNLDLAHALRDAGINTIVFHYRGCWGSDGDYRIGGVPADVGACLEFLSSGAPPEVDPDGLYLVGHSLGGWAALSMGADPRVRSVVTISAVVDPSSVTITEEDAAAYYAPWLRGVEPGEFVRQWSGAPAATESASLIAKPLLILHGGRDTVIPVEQADLALDAAPGPKELEIHPEADHAFIDHRPWLLDRVVSWLSARIAETEEP